MAKGNKPIEIIKTEGWSSRRAILPSCEGRGVCIRSRGEGHGSRDQADGVRRN